MAKVTAGAGYKELTKVGDYISPNINAAADRLAKQGMQQKELNATAKENAAKRLDEALGGITVNTDALQAAATGFETRDDVARDFAGTATKRSMEYAELAREAAKKGDWIAMNNYKGKIKRIEGDFKNTVNDEKILTDLFTGYQAKYQAGEVDDDDWLDFARAMERFDYKIELDENDNKVVTAIEMDDDGKPVLGDDGKPKVITKKWSDVVSQRDRPLEVVQLADKDKKRGLVGDILANMGKRKYDTETGAYIETAQVWDDTAEKQFMGQVKALQSNDRKMYSLLKQASGGEITEKANSKLSEEEKNANNKLVEDFLRSQVKGGYGEEVSLKTKDLTAEQKLSEAAKNRQVQREGHQITREANADDKEVALKRLALEEDMAKNPSKYKTKMTEKEKEVAENEALVSNFYDIAKKISELDSNASESEVQKILDDSGLGFVISGDLDDWMGFGKTEYRLSGKTAVQIKDVFANVKGMAKKAGITITDEELKKSLNKVQKGVTEADPLGIGI